MSDSGSVTHLKIPDVARDSEFGVFAWKVRHPLGSSAADKSTCYPRPQYRSEAMQLTVSHFGTCQDYKNIESILISRPPTFIDELHGRPSCLGISSKQAIGGRR